MRPFSFFLFALTLPLAAQAPRPTLPSSEELARQPQTKQAKGDQQRHYFLKDANREVPYRIFVPSQFDGKKKLPLIVALHGAGGTHDTAFQWGTNGSAGMIKDLAEKHGYIVVAPLGFPLGGSYGQHYNIGLPMSARAGGEMTAEELALGDKQSEADVIAVTKLVADEYNVDRTRIYLIGHSRGGLGTWYLGDKYREMWGGLAMIAGGFLDTDYPYEHLRGMPVFIGQGGKDVVALPERARKQEADMEKLGLHPVYMEVPEATHGSIPGEVLPQVFDYFDKNHKARGK
jgi:predicted peptidase